MGIVIAIFDLREDNFDRLSIKVPDALSSLDVRTHRHASHSINNKARHVLDSAPIHYVLT